MSIGSVYQISGFQMENGILDDSKIKDNIGQNGMCWGKNK